MDSRIIHVTNRAVHNVERVLQVYSLYIVHALVVVKARLEVPQVEHPGLKLTISWVGMYAHQQLRKVFRIKKGS